VAEATVVDSADSESEPAIADLVEAEADGRYRDAVNRAANVPY
jgi:hypothetical protein